MEDFHPDRQPLQTQYKFALKRSHLNRSKVRNDYPRWNHSHPQNQNRQDKCFREFHYLKG